MVIRMPWLLDTNAWIHYLKNPSSPVARRLRERTPADLVVCAVVRAELLHGAMKYGDPARRLAIVRDTLAPYACLPFDEVAAEHYARIRHTLEQSGNVIGPHDLLIAATCVAHGCVLVTANTGEFSRVAGLSIEDWVTS